jgi:glycine/D-amino acid oxidase-like deaminating enzyme
MNLQSAAMPTVGVVGGSLGGLTVALVLADIGCDVVVLERSAAELEARGAGIGRVSLRLPGCGVPSAMTRRVSASMATCRFAEYR